MAYTELIKNFNRIRDYMREFYVYGFKSRDEYTRKSARSYDDERRRIESWLGDYMDFRQTAEGKNVFMSIDSRTTRHNPLYKAWKAKSFTDGEITLHFILMDILADTEDALDIREIMERMDEYTEGFSEPKVFDESTIRKKLKEYTAEGIVASEKHGRTVCYRRAAETELPDTDVLDFFSEVAPCGVIGSYILDKTDSDDDVFTFKHHYMTGALDSGILAELFGAIREKRGVTLEMVRRNRDNPSINNVVPLKIMISAQSGRQYLMAYVPEHDRIQPYRTDNIVSVKCGELCEEYDSIRQKLEGMLPHMWGISTQGMSGSRMEHVDFTVEFGDREKHIPARLEREKRTGTVEIIDKHHAKFSADVYDVSELIPWIRTFISRITEIHFSDAGIKKQFLKDMEEMYEMYGLKGGDDL